MGAKIYFVLFFKKREKSRRMNEKKFKDFQKQMTSISKKKKSSILKEKKINFQGWSRTKNVIFQKKKKFFFKRTTKINQGFLFKRENSNQETNEDHTSQGNGTTKHASSKV